MASVTNNRALLNQLLEEAQNLPDAASAPSVSEKIVVFGDSLADGFEASTSTGNKKQYSYVSYLDEFEVIGNYAVSGSCFGDYNAASAGSNVGAISIIPNHTAEIAQADVVVLSYGGNDVGAVAAGRTNWTNVIAKTKQTFSLVRQANTEARIVVVCSAYGAASTDTVAASYTNDFWMYRFGQDLFAWLCDQYNVECINPFKSTGIDYSTTSLMQSDYSHPTVAGAKRIAESVGAQILHHDTQPRPINIYALLTPTNYGKHRFDVLATMMFTGCTVIGVFDDGNGNGFQAIASGTGTDGISWCATVESEGHIIELSYKLSAANAMTYNSYVLNATKM